MHVEPLEHLAVTRRGMMAALLALATSVPLLPGCSGPRQADAVDAGRAREALKTALDRWKKGDKPEALKDGSPPIVVQDTDWIEGAKLVDYHVEGDGKEVETNLYIPVKLTLRSRQGKEIKKSVSYVVATNPQLMVFRNLQ